MKNFRLLPNRCQTVLYVTLAVLIVGCSGNEESSQSSSTSSQSKDTTTPPDPAAIPMPEFSTGVCRVYGGDPESWVLVDGHPARDADSNYLSPPCEILVEQGNRTVSLTRPGYQDSQRVVIVSEMSEVQFPPLQKADENSVITANSPLFDWPIDQPFPLEQVNSIGRELDPYLSPDGLTLWFVGDREHGKAVYVSYRESIWHDFDPPEVLLLSRSASLPASPSVTADGLFLYYAQPESSRIVSLTRQGPLAEFRDQKKVLFDREMTAPWLTAQVLPDHLRLYWTTVTDQETQGFAAVRSSTDKDFSDPIPYPLPGLIPMLSPDGLRQYQFDGQTLSRSRRADVSSNFSRPETIHQFSLTDFQTDSNRRQFFVSADEQWMVYSSGAKGAEDLALVRLSKSPGWGVAPIGKPIPPKPVEVADLTKETDQKPAMTPDMKDKEPTVDPRSLPLPYQKYLVEWRAALAKRDDKTAESLTRQALQDDELSDSRDMLQQNLRAIEQIRKTWSLLDEAVTALEADSTVPLGTARARFETYTDGVLTFKLGNNSVQRTLRELPALTIINLIQKHLKPDDRDGLTALAYFLLYDGEGDRDLALNRVEPFADKTDEIIAEINRHVLHRAKLEFERENYPAGIVLLRAIKEAYPDSQAGQSANKMEQQLYQKTTWNQVGSRQWEQEPTLGQYAAKLERVENSYLKSEKSYRSFELQLEWKTMGQIGQGGIYFHYGGSGPVYDNAYKIHFANDFGVGPDQFCTGSLFGLEAPEKNAVKPQGEWNTSRLIVRGSSIMFILNGQTVLETFALSDELPEEGYVLLDGVTGGIIYRKVLLTELP
ncbi:MAG: DUF1080 domain-containing protein [Planctomycetaceae bacterium]|nr:DUF1080 domain-containing protein [Planctomycetaceae bacterium]